MFTQHIVFGFEGWQFKSSLKLLHRGKIKISITFGYYEHEVGIVEVGIVGIRETTVEVGIVGLACRCCLQWSMLMQAFRWQY